MSNERATPREDSPRPDDYDRATRAGAPVSERRWGRPPDERRVAETEARATAADWNGAPEQAGVGRERAWEPWSADEDVYEHMGGDAPATGVRESDEDRSDVLVAYELRQRLEDLTSVDAQRIGVAVDDGEVLLEGRVDDEETRRLAERLARETLGVRAVRNELEVEA